MNKSPLSYSGGKSKTLPQILPHIPLNITEHRDPLVRGGSVFLAVRSLFRRDIRYLINDLTCFWHFVRDDNDRLVAVVSAFYHHYQNKGRELLIKNY
jgi:DNA adenine methylase